MHGHAKTHMQSLDIFTIDQYFIWKVNAFLTTFKINHVHLKL